MKRPTMMPYIIMLLTLLPHCKKPLVYNETNALKTKAQQQTNNETDWCRIEKKRCSTQQKLSSQLAQGITRKQAVGIALQHHPGLQASFESLGIAKSDLAQAGLYTNPQATTLFQLPMNHDASRESTQISAQINFNISDFWQVPFKKKISQEELCITSLQILTMILNITADVQFAYNKCLQFQKILLITEEILHKVKEMEDIITNNATIKRTSDFDIHIAQIETQKWHIKKIQAHVELQKAYIELRRQLGIPISDQAITLLDSLTYDVGNIPDLSYLLNEAYIVRPNIQITLAQKRKAKAEISLEKARIFDGAYVGFGYQKDSDALPSFGPAFNFNIPIFNTNYGNISRAEFQYYQAKQEYKNQKAIVQEEVCKEYANTIALFQEIEVYQNQLLPTAQIALEHASSALIQNKLDVIVLLNARIQLYQLMNDLVNREYQATKAVIALERAVGKQLVQDLHQPKSTRTNTQIEFAANIPENKGSQD